MDPKKIVEEAAKRKKLRLNWDLSRVFFDKQMDVYNAIQKGGRYFCLRCGRRGGKSFTWGGLLIDYGLKYSKSTPIFVCMSRQDGRDIIWPVLEYLSDVYGLNLIFNKSSGDVTIPQTQSVIKIRGAGSMLEINKIRGKKYPIAIVDEAQAFGPDLEYLLDAALEPATADYHGPVCVSGTPNVAAAGPFFDIDQGKNSGAWEHWTWTFLDNPTMPDPQGFIDGVKKRRGWTDEHPSYQREYMGKWVRDADATAFRVKNHNIVPTFPEELAADWQWMMGIDVGFHDPFAFVVIASSQMLGQAFAVDCYQEAEIGTMEALTHAERFCAQYPITEIALDTGGAGRLVAEDWKKVSNLPIGAAVKTHKHSQVDLINGDLQAGKLLICEDNCRRLIDDLQLLEWDTGAMEKTRFVYRKGFADHLADALQYGFHLSNHHQHQFEEDKRIVYESPDWYAQKEFQMEQAMIKRVEERQVEDEGVWAYLAESAGDW
jgi:hypothetical protein